MKKGILIFAANVIPIVIAFFVGEVYLRKLGFQPYVRTFPGQYQNDPNRVVWAQSDPVLGWVSNKSDPEMNPQGFRDTRNFDTIDLNSGKTRIMILGDSFMWGAGVRADENVPNLLQKKLKDSYEVYNLGVPGWGIDQMYGAYQQNKDVIEPDIVILAFIDDDINRVLEAYRFAERMNKPSFAIKDGELTIQISASKNYIVLNKVMKKSVFFSQIMHQIYLTTEARSIVRHIFLDIAQETQSRKEKFVIIGIPTQDYFDPLKKFNRWLNNFEGLFQGTEVLYMDPSAEMTQISNWNTELYLDDGHLSAAANQYLADYIYEHVFEN